MLIINTDFLEKNLYVFSLQFNIQLFHISSFFTYLFLTFHVLTFIKKIYIHEIKQTHIQLYIH